MNKTKTKYLIWHSPRTGSNLLCNMLHQTGVAGVADYVNCGFPLGATSIPSADFPAELEKYEAKQTTPNGVFGCKLSWEVLRQLSAQVGLKPVMQWLSTIDHHFYLYRQDTIEQAVSLYIAKKRAYFSTQKTEGILATPRYDYDEIALLHRKIQMYRVEMDTYFEDYKIDPVRISFEAMTRHRANLQGVVALIVGRVSGEDIDCKGLEPEIKKQSNPAKQSYSDRFLLEWDAIK